MKALREIRVAAKKLRKQESESATKRKIAQDRAYIASARLYRCAMRPEGVQTAYCRFYGFDHNYVSRYFSYDRSSLRVAYQCEDGTRSACHFGFHPVGMIENGSGTLASVLADENTGAIVMLAVGVCEDQIAFEEVYLSHEVFAKEEEGQ